MTSTPNLDLLPAPGATDVLYLLDVSSWARAAYEGARAKGVDVDRADSVLVVQSVLRRLVDDVLVARRPAYLGACMDVSGDRGWRATVWPEYHQSRRVPGPGYARQLGTLSEVFIAHRIPVFQGAGFEADDYLGAVTKRARHAGLRVVLLSKDRDLWQLFERAAPDAVLAWDVAEKRVASADSCVATFGVGPERLCDFKALVGERDEAPGVDGIGEKTASELLARHADLAEVLAKAPLERPRIARALRDGAAAARLSLQLVTLAVEVPVHASLQHLACGWSEQDAQSLDSLGVKLGLPLLREAGVAPKPEVPAPLEERWLLAPFQTKQEPSAPRLLRLPGPRASDPGLPPASRTGCAAEARSVLREGGADTRLQLRAEQLVFPNFGGAE